ncbi:hypothetical protein E2C01_015005 [Portunus trituberculatus]|uniref:Uncharacterized protein n=1 Tax=Portunus trituberculatus TaxID=210409 RepID=A0A5B7DK68_PORTR|nr:hypothetical protein [Portunus trituberculatus]
MSGASLGSFAQSSPIHLIISGMPNSTASLSILFSFFRCPFAMIGESGLSVAGYSGAALTTTTTALPHDNVANYIKNRGIHNQGSSNSASYGNGSEPAFSFSSRCLFTLGCSP